MNFFDHKDLGNHLLHLCPKVVKHPVYVIDTSIYVTYFYAFDNKSAERLLYGLFFKRSLRYLCEGRISVFGR